ncbi:hypothetical protein CAPGI0001_0652 [Capnocytophaga gingivalis ATCC 33624]|nr:hypothetical protein CAPGI0001_0652 [Capnocytophaga gingivalis ATCC 33624]
MLGYFFENISYWSLHPEDLRSLFFSERFLKEDLKSLVLP